MRVAVFDDEERGALVAPTFDELADDLDEERDDVELFARVVRCAGGGTRFVV